MHAAELVSSTQERRLVAVNNPKAGFDLPAAGPRVDVYAIEYDAPKGGAYRKRSLGQAQKMADLLMGDRRVAEVLGRIVFLKGGGPR